MAIRFLRPCLYASSNSRPFLRGMTGAGVTIEALCVSCMHWGMILGAAVCPLSKA
jgi:hypothetical protein